MKCTQMEEIERMKNVCLGSIGRLDTDVSRMYLRMHEISKTAEREHLAKCQVCARERAA